MDKWTADFGNDPYDDYNLIVEVLYEDRDVAVIKQGENGLELIWYPTEKNLSIPLGWLMDLLAEAEKRLNSN